MNRFVFLDALSAIAEAEWATKQAFVAGGGAPPMDPAMMAGGGMPPGGAPPMDPAMMAGGGAPPMDPAMMAAMMPPGGGAPPMDPAMMAGGMAPGGATPPPTDPSATGGSSSISREEVQSLIDEAVSKAQQNAANPNGSAGGAKGTGKTKLNMELVLDTMNRRLDATTKILRSITETLKIPIPPSVLDDPPSLAEMGQDQSNPSQSTPSSPEKPQVEKGSIQGLEPVKPAFDKISSDRVFEVLHSVRVRPTESK